MTGRTPAQLRRFIEAEAHKLGLDCAGVADLRTSDATTAARRLSAFLAAGRHGGMTWMAETEDRRCDPTKLWPEAQSAILIGHSYAPVSDPLSALAETSRGVVSVYAKGRDYHDVLKGKIRSLARAAAEASGADVKIFVDTAPLMEKPLAQQAGLGWQGKHTNLVSRTHGSWLFLGVILTTAEIAADTAEIDHCGSCRRCLDVCPTNAFPGPYQLDARRCIAYLTIEHKGQIAREFRKAIGNRIFGCDDCLAVCPWNKFAKASHEARYAARIEADNPPISELLSLDDASFRARFAGTPVKRTGRDRVVRNALIAAGNSGDASLIERVTTLLDDPSPLVRGMAVWAIHRLVPSVEAETLRREKFHDETDACVKAEWSTEETDMAT
jgi:epoxyqueuosine reductase